MVDDINSPAFEQVNVISLSEYLFRHYSLPKQGEEFYDRMMQAARSGLEKVQEDKIKITLVQGHASSTFIVNGPPFVGEDEKMLKGVPIERVGRGSDPSFLEGKHWDDVWDREILTIMAQLPGPTTANPAKALDHCAKHVLWIEIEYECEEYYKRQRR
eukprot:TRINITY_DN51973_c0_g2_i1.p2 TRINITY_DN51973_c0_g2~~TRINITY_DN51973_c0_g2_i1.p2  ORF type:complete len:158 (-),score=40.76 TRINITY_DN51973_c0_g2_i1:33-506(-)